MKYLIITLFALIASPALAHHPETGAHFHAIDLIWFYAFLALCAVAILMGVRHFSTKARTNYRGER